MPERLDGLAHRDVHEIFGYSGKRYSSGCTDHHEIHYLLYSKSTERETDSPEIWSVTVSVRLNGPDLSH